MNNNIKLTKSDIHKNAKESVEKAIKETADKHSRIETNYWDDDCEQDELTEYPETFDEIYNDGQWQVILGGDGGRNIERCYYVNHPPKNYQNINNAWQYWDFLITLSDGVRVIDGRSANEKTISLNAIPIDVIKELAEDYYDFEQMLSEIIDK